MSVMLYTMWGKKIFQKTMKHIFQKHFYFLEDNTWDLNPSDKEKVRKRVIPTLRMVESWVMGHQKVSSWTDDEVVKQFLYYMRHAHPEFYESNKTNTTGM